LPEWKKAVDLRVLKVIRRARTHVTPEESTENESEVVGHGAGDGVDDVVVDDDEDEPDVQAHAGWGSA
jgi:hypothetical protein